MPGSSSGGGSVTMLKINLASPVAHSWTGAGDGIHWADANNWAGGLTPSSTDDVVISASGTNPTVTLDTGSYSVHSLTSGRNLTISSTGSLTVSGKVAITGTLTLQNSAQLTLAAGSNSLATVNGLSITGSATMDLNDNDLILDYSGASQLAAVQNLINSARSNGTWTGTGLTSTAAKKNLNHNTTLGAMEATDYAAVHGGSFDGISPDATAVLVKYTYYGDANFDGTVNFDDYVRTDVGFNTNLTGWSNGDFNSSGNVNFDDYVLIDIAFNTQGSSLARDGAATALMPLMPSSTRKNLPARLDSLIKI
jgi:hypothetical protein